MNPAELHLILTHVPVVGFPIGVALLAYGLFRKHIAVERAALVLIGLLSLACVGTYLSGEGAENLLMSKENPDLLRSWIHEHEEMAESAFILVLITGALAIALLTRRVQRLSWSPWILRATLVAGLIASGLLALTAHLGGEVRHTEIRSLQ